jgi:hypothetical protein
MYNYIYHCVTTSPDGSPRFSPQRFAIWASPRLEPRQATVEDDGVTKRADAVFAPAKLSFRQA